MKRTNRRWFTLIVFLSVLISPAYAGSAPDVSTDEPEKGPHGGRLLTDGDFALELTIFETGVPPQYRVWASWAGQAIPPSQVQLTIKLTRLGDVVDNINFTEQTDFLRGDKEVYEPHSFFYFGRSGVYCLIGHRHPKRPGDGNVYTRVA